jgi:hypothetical protein
MGLEGREGGAATEAAPPGLAANGCQHQSKYLVLRPGVSGCLRLEDRGFRTDRCDLILGPKEAYHLPGGGGGIRGRGVEARRFKSESIPPRSVGGAGGAAGGLAPWSQLATNQPCGPCRKEVKKKKLNAPPSKIVATGGACMPAAPSWEQRERAGAGKFFY